jgi:hypothetical protein
MDVDLDERSGQLLLLPWRRRFARAQPYDHLFPPRRLSRTQRYVLDDAVALVEDAEDRDALRHRRHSALACAGHGRIGRRRGHRVLLRRAFPARSQRERSQKRCGDGPHAYSGIQGS